MSAKWLMPALTYLCFVRAHSPCLTPDGEIGDCKRIDTCESLKKLVQDAVVVQPETFDHIRKSKCGIDQATGLMKVCCSIEQTSCLTQENKVMAGQCLNVFDCDHIKNGLSAPIVTQQNKDYVYSLRCQGNASFSVCCGLPPGPEPVPTPAPSTTYGLPRENQTVLEPRNSANVGCTLSAQPPDPAGVCCGHGGFDTKILGGSDAAIDQYPWLALLEYQKEDKIKLLCGGVLISGRYVLTAGHCVMRTVRNGGAPKNVRLGEYDITNPGKDCVQLDGSDDDDCTLDPVIIPIEKIIRHPEYAPRNFLRRNDIAMLRLVSIPAYTDFVRPICLPTVDITANFPETGSLYVAGWGAVSDKIPFSNVKQHVNLPFKTIQVCQQAYRTPGLRVNLWERQVCAGGERGKDSCNGDSGGPLMYHDGTHFELIGLVSFGPMPCGLENVPGVYTKVFDYLPWIRSNIKP